MLLRATARFCSASFPATQAAIKAHRGLDGDWQRVQIIVAATRFTS
jgi:hypothetical protein